MIKKDGNKISAAIKMLKGNVTNTHKHTLRIHHMAHSFTDVKNVFPREQSSQLCLHFLLK